MATLLSVITISAAATAAASATASFGGGPPELADPGPFAVSMVTLEVARLDGTTFEVPLRYPAATSDPAAPPDVAAGPFPVVLFAHGYLQPSFQYDSTLDHLASWGFLVASPDSALELFPDHAAFAADLSATLDRLALENDARTSRFFGLIDVERVAAGGHSMGGGAALLAAAADDRFRLVLPLAPAETNPSAIEASSTVNAPVRFIVGDEDAITPTATNAAPMYASVPVARQLSTIPGGYHCGFIDEPILFCDSGSISGAAQRAIVRRVLTETLALALRPEPGCPEESCWMRVWGPMLNDAPGEVFTTSDPRAEVFLPDGLAAPSGAIVSIGVPILNQQPSGTSYAVILEPALTPIPVNSSPAETPVIGPGEVFDAAAAIVGGPTPGGVFTVTVSARNLTDGFTRAFDQMTIFTEVLGDLNGDDAVGPADLAILLSGWGPCGGVCPGDLNGDGEVSAIDLAVLLAAWSD